MGMLSDIDIPLISRNRRGGFSLIELAIVMVVIGLVIGGVMVGKELINAARVRSVLTEVEKFNSVAKIFVSKYECAPGDCAHATKFFGEFASCDGWSGSQDLGNATCNGDGDGKVEQVDDIPGRKNWWRYDEQTLFWQHLSLAGLLEIKYSGAVNWTIPLVPGENVPKSRVDGGCYSVQYSIPEWWDAPQYLPVTPMLSTYIMLGGSVAYMGLGTNMGTCSESLYSFSATDASSLDGKIDDGKPFEGNVQTPIERYGGSWNYSGEANRPGCTNSTGGSTWPYNSDPALYDVTAPVSGCQLFFKATF
jgi:prepilin-type N-terminal cleavage/methylation domain-containing protein